MSQLELDVRSLLARRPEIEKCYQAGLLNRRALARFLVAEGVARSDQFDALIATLRRQEAVARSEGPAPADLFPSVRLGLKDRILLLDFEKERSLLERLQELIAHINYDRGDTLKIIVGTTSIKLLIDEAKEAEVRHLFDRFRPRHRAAHLSELSLQFPEAAIETPGVLSRIAREFVLNDVTITELLTASPELLIYLRDEHVPRAYEILRALQGGGPRAPGSPRPADRGPTVPGQKTRRSSK